MSKLTVRELLVYNFTCLVVSSNGLTPDPLGSMPYPYMENTNGDVPLPSSEWIIVDASASHPLDGTSLSSDVASTPFGGEGRTFKKHLVSCSEESDEFIQ